MVVGVVVQVFVVPVRLELRRRVKLFMRLWVVRLPIEERRLPALLVPPVTGVAVVCPPGALRYLVSAAVGVG